MIHLGYETGTGKPVSIPLAHMAVTGMTQQSGKTTTLEALIHRGELRAVVFVTKPGEKSFTEGLRILPFFKEHADWEYVKELLEARRAESLSKWDGYLMRVCSRAKTLQDVRNNVENELPKKKSTRPSHYEVLAGYLDLIIPELDRVEYTDKLELRRGVNIMDLSVMSDDMQSMVMRSTIEQIHKREKNTVLVLPEAWKFIPEGGRSAVFQSLQALVREGATNGNYVWLDAQDLAVVSKRILKSVSVWILGKQQEANEVARTINHLIEPLQIRPDMIKSLGIGQFLICADSHPARRVYVQPRWLGELDALAIARGEESVETAQAIFRQKKRELVSDRRTSISHTIIPRPSVEADDALGVPSEWRKTHNDEKQNIVLPAAGQGRAENKVRVSPAVSAPHDHSQSGNRQDGNTTGVESVETSNPQHHKNSPDSGRGKSEDETMWKERAEKAEAEVIQLRADVQNLRQMLSDYRGTQDPGPNGGPPPDAAVTAIVGGAAVQYDLNFIYSEMKHRAQNDPGILQILANRPELRVVYEPKLLEVEGKTLRGGIALLIHRGFFSIPRNGYAVFNELQRIGRKVATRTVYDELDRIAGMGFLTKEPDGFQATDLKVTVRK
jgi:hypothetical protein